MIATIDSPGPGEPYAEVIGDPVVHSKSPLIHSFWLSALGIDGAYRACHVPPEELGNYITRRRDDPNWRGCNVTIPHKINALDHVADPGWVRSSIGAVNTIFRQADGTLAATNTDAAGFYAPIANVPLAGKHVVVIGAGGAARAVLFALACADVGKVTILNRNPLKARALLAHFELEGQALPLEVKLPAAALLVNASALGMVGQGALDCDLTPLPVDAIVYDCVYAPLLTNLLAQAEERGLATVDGLEMLVGQAGVAFELFFGVAPPRARDGELRKMLIGA
ncbi:MAG: shikimate dehydrogenase [Sphingopyxis sp.]